MSEIFVFLKTEMKLFSPFKVLTAKFLNWLI